jgi:hypothetical protein
MAPALTSLMLFVLSELAAWALRSQSQRTPSTTALAGSEKPQLVSLRYWETPVLAGMLVATA